MALGTAATRVFVLLKIATIKAVRCASNAKEEGPERSQAIMVTTTAAQTRSQHLLGCTR